MILGALSVLVYERLDGVVPGLALAEPSGAWQVFPWISRPPPRVDAATGIEVINHSEGLFTLALAGLVGCYAAMLAVIRTGQGRALALAVFIFGVVFQVQQLDSPALISSDPFSYLIYGRIAAIHGADPYVDTPDGFPDDPLLPFVYWKHVPSFYGPLWTALSSGLALMGGDNVGLGILLIRSVAAAAALGCGVIIWLALRSNGDCIAVSGAALWLWNPLLPLEAGMSGHNDVLLVLPMLGALLCARTGRAVAVGALCAAAAFVKIVALLIAPVLLWTLIRNSASAFAGGRGVAAAVGGMTIVGLAVLTLGRSPLEGSGVGALGADTARYTNSVHELALAVTRLALGDSPDDIRTPLYFRPWPARTTDSTALWTSSGEGRRLVASISTDSPVTVLAPSERGWRRVAESATGRVGYVPADHLIEAAPLEGETALVDGDGLWLANSLVRILAYAVFGACAIRIGIALWRGASPAGTATALFLSLLLTTATWIWPWYLLWPLGFAALSPPSRMVRLTLVLSISSLLIYPLFGYQGTQAWWAFNFRSLVVWVLPLLVFGVLELNAGRARERRAVTVG